MWDIRERKPNEERKFGKVGQKEKFLGDYLKGEKLVEGTEGEGKIMCVLVVRIGRYMYLCDGVRS